MKFILSIKCSFLQLIENQNSCQEKTLQLQPPRQVVNCCIGKDLTDSPWGCICTGLIDIFGIEINLAYFWQERNLTAISKCSHDNKVREYFLFNNCSAYFLFSLNQSLKFCFILKRQLLLTALTIIIILNLAYILDIAKAARFYILLLQPPHWFRRR